MAILGGGRPLVSTRTCMSAEATSVILASGRANADLRYLTLLQLSDLHGYFEPHADIRWCGGMAELSHLGGLARIATAFD